MKTDINNVNSNPANQRLELIVSSHNGVYTITNGVMRLKAALKKQGYADVTDSKTGRQFRIIRNTDGQLVEDV